MTTPEKHLADLLASLGFSGDPEMEGTPARVAELLRSFVPAAEPPRLSSFPAPAGARSGAVTLRDVPFYSLCAHHLLPFFGTATIAYLPGDKVAGFSALSDAVRHFADRPQIQERLAEQIADHLFDALAPRGLVVRLVARQLCMEMRGDRSTGEAEVVVHRGPEADALLAGAMKRAPT